jgi:hypothetical protein
MSVRGQVDVHLADVEPVASFIGRVHAAYALFGKMTAVEAADLPGCVASGIADLHAAIRDLGAGQPAAAGADDDDDDDG